MTFVPPLFETIVVGVDGRQGGRDALRLGRQLAEAGGGQLVAVRAFPYHYRPAVKGAPAVEEERRATLAALERELSHAGIASARTHVVGDSSPARALHRIVERERADLLVVGSTHRGRIGRAMAGRAQRAGRPARRRLAPLGAGPPDPAGQHVGQADPQGWLPGRRGAPWHRDRRARRARSGRLCRGSHLMSRSSATDRGRRTHPSIGTPAPHVIAKRRRAVGRAPAEGHRLTAPRATRARVRRRCWLPVARQR